MNVSKWKGCFVGVFTNSIVMCKILTVVIAFYLWVLANSTFFGCDSLPLILIDLQNFNVKILAFSFHMLLKSRILMLYWLTFIGDKRKLWPNQLSCLGNLKSYHYLIGHVLFIVFMATILNRDNICGNFNAYKIGFIT